MQDAEVREFIRDRQYPACKTPCPKVKFLEKETAKKNTTFKERSGGNRGYKYRIGLTNILPLPTKKKRKRTITLTPKKVEWVKTGIFSKQKIITPAKTYTEWQEISDEIT